MVVYNSGISWCTGTLNPWVGCKAVSEGCRHCYAKAMVENARYGSVFGHPFEEVKLHLGRLDQIRKFRPIFSGGRLLPPLIFMNSMSDFFLEDVPDTAVHQALDSMEAAPGVVFQVLSKRPVRARKVLADRYGGKGVPDHMWFGFSVESNEVRGRVDILRKIKDRVGSLVAFLSIEPIVGPTDLIDLAGVDWVITGGESGPKARVMNRSWLLPPVELAVKAGISVWHKQSGQPRSHPNILEAPQELGIKAQFQWLVDNGREHLPAEKGGATIDGKTYRRFPPAYAKVAERLN